MAETAMTRTQHLLDCLIEECAETIQRATKAKRFGLAEVQPKQPLTNLERIVYELNDIVAVADMLEVGWMDEQAVDAKREKVEKYLAYSQECGLLKED